MVKFNISLNLIHVKTDLFLCLTFLLLASHGPHLQPPLYFSSCPHLSGLIQAYTAERYLGRLLIIAWIIAPIEQL